MFPRSPAAFPGLLVCGVAIALILGGCRTNERKTLELDRYFQEEPQEVAEARRNRLESEPTAFLRRRATDPINWQPWSAELFEHAHLEQRPIFAVVTAGAFAGSQALLDRLKGDAGMIRTLNTDYICSIVDIHAHPELALYATLLAREINRPVYFPFMMWFSHEGNPIAWLPLSKAELASFDEVFGNSHEMITRIWNDDPRYVVTNSRRDNQGRIARVESGLSRKENKKKVDHLAVRHQAARELSSLYDPTSRSIDRAGGLVPFSLLHFASSLAGEPATPENLRLRLVEMVRGHTALLLESAVHDPLEGGFFRGRQSRGWSLPVFVKDSTTQIEGILAFSSLARLADRETSLASARSLLSYLENRFVNEEIGGVALYEYPAPRESAANAYLWSRESLREQLPEEEFPVVEKCFGISGLGNIPIEADPRRIHFRLNSLRNARTPHEVAGELGLTPQRARDLFDSARQRLVVRRRQLLETGKTTVESTRITSVNARFAAALAELSASSNDPALLVRAREVIDMLRQRHYSEEGGLVRIPAAGGCRAIPARGLDYAMLLDALFRVYRHDLDPRHLGWAERLGREAFAKLSDAEGLLLETPEEDRILTVPMHDHAMVVGNSTWGVIYGPLVRLHQLTGAEKFGAARAALDQRLTEVFPENPLVHTDYGLASQAAQSDTLVYLDGPGDNAQLANLHRVVREPQYAGVTVVRLDPALAPAIKVPKPGRGTRAIVWRAGEQAGVAATGEELRALLDAPAREQ